MNQEIREKVITSSHELGNKEKSDNTTSPEIEMSQSLNGTKEQDEEIIQSHSNTEYRMRYK